MRVTNAGLMTYIIGFANGFSPNFTTTTTRVLPFGITYTPTPTNTHLLRHPFVPPLKG
jgi:hypothetical protein